MIDFSLTESGDIMLSATFVQKSPVQIDFSITDSKAVMVEFFLTGFNEQKRDGICISFDITDNDKKAVSQTVKDLDFIKQAVAMRLNTPLGELSKRKEMGSKLESIRHDRLYDKRTIVAAEEIAYEAIKDILPLAKVKAEPNVQMTSNGYDQSIDLHIYDEDTIIKYRMR